MSGSADFDSQLAELSLTPSKDYRLLNLTRRQVIGGNYLEVILANFPANPGDHWFWFIKDRILSHALECSPDVDNFPDLKGSYATVSNRKATQSSGSPVCEINSSALLDLPLEILDQILEWTTLYIDVVRLASTCTTMLERLAPTLHKVGVKYHACRTSISPVPDVWKGDRIVLLGSDYRLPHTWDVLKQHVQREILNAAMRRGVSRDDLEPDIKRSLDEMVDMQDPFWLPSDQLDQENEVTISPMVDPDPDLIPGFQVTFPNIPSPKIWREAILHWRSQSLIPRFFSRTPFRPSSRNPDVDSAQLSRIVQSMFDIGLMAGFQRCTNRVAALSSFFSAYEDLHSLDITPQERLVYKFDSHLDPYQWTHDQRCVVLNLDTREFLQGTRLQNHDSTVPSNWIITRALIWVLSMNIGFGVKDVESAERYTDGRSSITPGARIPTGRWAGCRLALFDQETDVNFDGIEWNSRASHQPGWVDVSDELWYVAYKVWKSHVLSTNAYGVW